MDEPMFVRDGEKVRVAIPAPLNLLLAHFAAIDPDDGVSYDHAPATVSVAGSADDMFAALEAEMIADRLRETDTLHRSETLAFVQRLFADAGGVGTETVLEADDARMLAQWLNSWYFRLRAGELGEISIGEEQTSFVFDDDEDEHEPMAPPTALFAWLHEELEECLDGPVEF